MRSGFFLPGGETAAWCLPLLVFAGAGFSVFSRLFPEQRARLFRRWEAVADGDGGQAEGLVATEGEPAPAYGTAP